MRLWIIAALAACLAAAPAPGQEKKVETGFLNRKIAFDGKEYRYVVYLPHDYTPERQWPVILFLHGAGERGSDGLAQTQVGLGAAIRFHPERFPAIAVFPQCPREQRWDGIPNAMALAALEAVMAEFRGDPDRQYLTGLSMGGFGSWQLAARFPDRFAAIAPICGGGDPKAMAEKVKDLPIWVFHGDRDEAVPVARSREMVEAVKAAGSTKIRYTEYAGVGHNSWDAAYNDPAFAEWLFAQKR